jgi:streptogramin lyase
MPFSHTIFLTFSYHYIYSAGMRSIGIGLLLILSTSCFSQNPIPPIGQWREHLNYQNAIQVIKGDQIYCATATNVFSVNDKQQISRYSKITGLNDINVQCIGWDESTGQLLIAYANSNLDAVKKEKIKNIGDIKRSSISGNKIINAVFCRNGSAYLSTGLGVVVVNLSKYEISDTWLIGNTGGQVLVNAFCSDGSFFYAATLEGLKRASVNEASLSDYTKWQNISGINGLATGSVSNIIFSNSRIIAHKNDSILLLNGTTWNTIYTNAAWPITSITASENKVMVCQRNSSGAARVLILNTSGTIEKILSQNGVISSPRSALLENGAAWIADQFGGLSRFGAAVDRFIPNGPLGSSSGDMVSQNNVLYVAAGSVNNAWNYLFNRNGIYQLKEDQWSYRGYFNTPVLDSVLDFITLAVDPTDGSLWGGSYGGGLVHFKGDAQPFIYKKSSSTLQPAIGDPNSYRVSGLGFDQSNQLWISNYGAAQNLHVRKPDGSWKAFAIPFSLLENAVSQIVVDDLNQVWIVSPKDNGLVCFNYGQNIDNTNDDKWKLYRQGSGNGNLPSNNVLCILKEKNGFIWVGTDKGIGIIQCPGDVFGSSGCDAMLPVVQQDRFTGLLFKDEIVQCMAVDGANRKWIGTRNGVWLISPDGEKIIYRFTEENSPLLSNDIKKITVDPVSGEVFIATFNGICSFRSTATEGGNTHENVLVFPNPVPPGYNGTIAIRGLSENSLVKITELNGRLVYQTRSLGGQASWNGYSYNGNKAASGVYLVLVRDDSGNEKMVTKIVIISGR